MLSKLLFSRVSIAALLTFSFGFADLAPFNFVTSVKGIAQAQTSTIVLERLSIQAGVYKFIVPRLEVTGTTLTKNDLKSIFDSKSKEPAKVNLAKLNFQEAIIPELIVETKIADRADRQVYKNVKLTGAVAGKIAFMSADGGSFNSKTAGKGSKTSLGTFKGSYDAMLIEGLDLVAIAQIFNEKSDDENAPMQTIYTSYMLNGLQFEINSSDNDMKFSTGKMVAGAFKSRAGKYGFLEFAEILKENPDLDDMDTSEKAKLFNGTLQIFSNFDLGPWQIDNLAVNMKVKDKEATSKKTLDFKIASIKFGQLDTNFRMDDLSMLSPDDKVFMKIASYEVKGYSFKPTLEAAKAFIAAGKFEAEDIANLDYREFMPVLGGSEIKGLEIQAPDRKGDFGGSNIKMGIGSIKTSLSNQIRGIPTALSYKLNNLTIDIPAVSTNQGFQIIRDNGMERFDFSATIDAKWLEESKEFALTDISVIGEKLGSFKLSGAIGNMPREIFSGSMSTAQILALALTAKAAEIRIENKGLLDIALKAVGKDKDKSPEDLKKDLVSGVKEALKKLIGETEKSKAVIAGVETFLQNGKSLTISVKPKSVPDRSLDGIGAMEIFLAKEPKDVLDKLDVDVRAE